MPAPKEQVLLGLVLHPYQIRVTEVATISSLTSSQRFSLSLGLQHKATTYRHTCEGRGPFSGKYCP